MVRRDLERGLTDYFERGKYNLPFSVDRISREETEKCKDIDSYIILNFDIDSIRGCGDRFIHIHVQQLIQFCKKKSDFRSDFRRIIFCLRNNSNCCFFAAVFYS